MKYLSPFFNPIQWIKAIRFAKKNAKYEKSSYDLELFLYSKMLRNNMLHYAYFGDINIRPEAISFDKFEEAQMKYAESIIEHIENKNDPVLDVGCGMGGLSQLLKKQGYDVESLTPNKNQIELIRNMDNQMVLHPCKYEEFKTNKLFGTIINSESLQYISLDEAFEKSNEIIIPGGRWIISDYFSLEKKGDYQKPHHIDLVRQKIKEYNWEIIYEKDITLNILPTLSYIEMYVNRFLMPLKQFAYEKLRYKKPKIFYLTSRLRELVDKKIEKESNTVTPSIFLKERKYMFFVLQKTSIKKQNN